jgi:hypothetical protein
MHIGKTAGSTLGNIIDRHYANDRLYVMMQDKDNETFAAQPETLRARVEMIRGMTYYGIHRAIPREARYFTLYRHPVDRVISQYFYVQRRKKRENPSANVQPLEGFLERNPFHTQMQLGLTVGADDKRLAQSQPLDSSHIAVAHANLARHFSLVGTVDRFDEALVLMKQRFGWRNIAYAKRNVAPEDQRTKVTPAQLKLIETMCALEIEFYEQIKEAFAAELRDQPPAFAREVDALQSGSRRYSLLWNATSGLRRTPAWMAFRRRFWPAWTPWEDDADA